MLAFSRNNFNSRCGFGKSDPISDGAQSQGLCMQRLGWKPGIKVEEWHTHFTADGTSVVWPILLQSDGLVP